MFQSVCNNGSLSDNDDDTFLKARYNIEAYRINSDTLALYFASNSTVNNILPKLKEEKIKLTLQTEGDYESVYHFSVKDIHKIHKIVKFQTKGKNISPRSIKTTRRQVK